MKFRCDDEIELLEMEDAKEAGPKELDIFKKHCAYWVKAFGLGNYSIECVIDPTLGHVGAYTEMHHNEMQMIIGMHNYTDTYSLGYLARHEMLEVLIQPMYELCDGYASDRRSQKKGHEVIFRLEKILPIPSELEIGVLPEVKKNAKTKKAGKSAGGKLGKGNAAKKVPRNGKGKR